LADARGVSELPATPLGGVRLAGDPPVTSDVPAAPKAVIAEGVMPLPASAPAVPAAPAPEPQAESAALPIESLLLRFRMITPAQLADAMKEEAVSGKSVATIVVEKGWVAAEAMAQIAPDTPAAPAPATAPTPAAAPAPIFEPVAVEPTVAEAPAPAPAPEPAPVAPEPVAPLMPEPVAEQPVPQQEAPVAAAAPPAPFVPEPEPQPETLIEVLAPVAEPVPEPAPVEVAVADLEPEPAPASAPLVFQVLAHLANGECVEISRAADMDEAKAAATAAMQALRDGGDWPLLSGRYVRPESIISIDVALLFTAT
jgi:hypothetical protein